MPDLSPERGKKRIKMRWRFLRNNAWLKIISLVIAAFLWLFVTNYHDPEVVLTVTNVQVKLLHTDVLQEEGKVCTVLYDTDVIPVVTVTAPRSIVDALESDNIVATADVQDMNGDGTVPIQLTTNKYSDSITNISGSIREVRLSVEDEKRATLTITASTTGEVEDGYVIGSISMEQNQVRITGPESKVDEVASAGVTIDVSGATSSISTNAEIHLYDEDGVDIDLDGDLTLSVDKVMTSVEVLQTKEVPVKIAVTGTPADGYQLSGDVTIEPSSVTIAGKRSAIEDVESISIPSSELDVSGMGESLVKTVDITRYLPDGVSLADPESDKSVKVTVEIIASETEVAASDSTESTD